jgi:hypothetical protein
MMQPAAPGKSLLFLYITTFTPEELIKNHADGSVRSRYMISYFDVLSAYGDNQGTSTLERRGNLASIHGISRDIPRFTGLMSEAIP